VYTSYQKDAMELVAAGCGERENHATHERRRSQRRAAMVTGWKANRFYFDAVQQAISYFSRGRSQRKNSKMLVRLTGETKSSCPATTTQRLRHGDQSRVDAQTARKFFSFRSQPHSRYRRILANESGAWRGGPRNSLRRNKLESAPRFFS